MIVCMQEFMRRHRIGIRGGDAKDVVERGRGGESWDGGVGGERRHRFLRRGGLRVVESYDGAAFPP